MSKLKRTDFKTRLPHRFLHVCSGCGKREMLSNKEPMSLIIDEDEINEPQL